MIDVRSLQQIEESTIYYYNNNKSNKIIKEFYVKNRMSDGRARRTRLASSVHFQLSG